MPIKACADRLKNETELYGGPPVVPEEEAQAPPAEVEAGSAGDEGAKKKTKGKVAAKKTKGTTQWDILRNSGIPEEDIPKFQCAPALPTHVHAPGAPWGSLSRQLCTPRAAATEHHPSPAGNGIFTHSQTVVP